jgi:hypothetical protein
MIPASDTTDPDHWPPCRLLPYTADHSAASACSALSCLTGGYGNTFTFRTLGNTNRVSWAASLLGTRLCCTVLISLFALWDCTHCFYEYDPAALPVFMTWLHSLFVWSPIRLHSLFLWSGCTHCAHCLYDQAGCTWCLYDQSAPTVFIIRLHTLCTLFVWSGRLHLMFVWSECTYCFYDQAALTISIIRLHPVLRLSLWWALKCAWTLINLCKSSIGIVGGCCPCDWHWDTEPQAALCTYYIALGSSETNKQTCKKGESW